MLAHTSTDTDESPGISDVIAQRTVRHKAADRLVENKNIEQEYLVAVTI